MTRPLIATLLLTTALGLAACGKTDEAKPAKASAASPARAVTVGRVESRPLGAGFEASGQLVPREEAAVGSELAGYRVARVFVEEGAYVRAGQPLVQLDDTLLRAQIAQQAALTAQAQAEATRVAGLDGQGVLSQEQIESRRYAAKAQEAALAELRTRSSRMTITAPVGGRVLERTVRLLAPNPNLAQTFIELRPGPLRRELNRGLEMPGGFRGGGSGLGRFGCPPQPLEGLARQVGRRGFAEERAEGGSLAEMERDQLGQLVLPA